MEILKLKLYEKKHKETGKDYAYRVLKDNIMSIQLKPGDLLSESDLSQKLNISRTPIREVLMKLKAEHLIEVKPQSGTYISLIDWNLIEEAIFMRYTLEKEVLKEACESFPDEILMELEKNIFAQSLIIDKEDNDIEFHALDKYVQSSLPRPPLTQQPGTKPVTETFGSCLLNEFISCI